MKIRNLRFNNLYSYEQCSMPLGSYNVIVGPNNSGKTNITRILKLLISGERHQNLERITIRKELRFKPDHDSFVSMEAEFSDKEARLLAQFILLRSVKADDEVLSTFKRANIIITWSKTPDPDNVSPDLLLVRFDNGFTLYQMENYPFYLSYTRQLPDDLGSFKQIISEIKQLDRDLNLTNKFAEIHGYGYEKLRQNKELETALLDPDELQKLFSIDDATISAQTSKGLQYANNTDYNVELYTFLYPGIERRDYNSDFWVLVRNILRDSIVLVKEIRPTYEELAEMIFLLKTRAEFQKEYQELADRFREIFVGINFDVFERESTSTPAESREIEKYIQVSNGNDSRGFRLEDSASGFFEILYILAQIANSSNRILVLDEPALHLHPTKITLLSRVLTRNTSNQTVIVTHSPKFLEQKILQTEKGSRLIYVRRENGISKAITPKSNFNKIKKHEFKGEVFFSQCNILVEGPADHATLIAASELLGDLFTRYDVEVINVDGKESFEKWFEMLDAFNIPWIAMADQDFKPNAGYQERVIRLDGKLEDLFRKLGWNGSGKLTSTQAYDFITQIKDEERKKQLFDTEIGHVISQSLHLIHVEPSEALKDYHRVFAIRKL